MASRTEVWLAAFEKKGEKEGKELTGRKSFEYNTYWNHFEIV